MKIDFHCRGCNQTGTLEISLKEILGKRKNDELLMDLIIDEVKHECENTNVGVKVHEES